MSEVVYRSRVTIERVRGPVRRAQLPGRDEPVMYGMHGAVAEHYGVSPEDFPSEATTLDHVVGAAGG